MPKNRVFGGFDGEAVKILSSDPQKALPRMNTRLLMYCMSKSVQRFELYVRGKIMRTKRKLKKMSGNYVACGEIWWT